MLILLIVDTNGYDERYVCAHSKYRVGQKSDTSRTYITLYERYHFFGPPGSFVLFKSYLNSPF